ncbi:MAG: cellulase family glycosylhydrolase [Actinomycetota bacterium]|nr:cellulase family glycosylhydrolase [Actinomycetota bacterium]
MPPPQPLPWLRVDGDRIVDPDGATVHLRGVGLGGWMNMENFITGYAGNESAMRARLRAVMGPAAYDAFFDALDVAFFDEADAAFLASIGVNSVRIPVNQRRFEDDARPFELLDTGFDQLDRVVSLLGRHGIWSIIDLHAVPGCQNHHWHSDNPTHVAAFWDHPHFQDRVVHLWEALADRFRDRPEVAGYNPLNEPADESGEVLPAFYRRLEAAIRAVDPDHVLFLDGNRYSTDFACFDEPFDNAVYACHDYALPGIAGATEYPGVTRGEYVDRGVVEATFLRRSEFMRRTGTPIWVGEFGPMYPPGRPQDTWRHRLLADQLDIYRDHGAGWSLWTYKDVGLQGLAHTRPESRYAKLIEPIRELKDRLGVDSWGGSDLGVRDVLDPIDEVLDRHVAGYEPYPWGRRQHVFRLVRHILLAEPVADRYAELFRGVTPDEARELADSFRLEECTIRTEVVDLLRTHLTPA